MVRSKGKRQQSSQGKDACLPRAVPSAPALDPLIPQSLGSQMTRRCTDVRHTMTVLIKTNLSRGCLGQRKLLYIFIVLDRGEYGFDLKPTDQPQNTLTDDRICVPRAFVEGAARVGVDLGVRFHQRQPNPRGPVFSAPIKPESICLPPNSQSCCVLPATSPGLWTRQSCFLFGQEVKVHCSGVWVFLSQTALPVMFPQCPVPPGALRAGRVPPSRADVQPCSDRALWPSALSPCPSLGAASCGGPAPRGGTAQRFCPK